MVPRALSRFDMWQYSHVLIYLFFVGCNAPEKQEVKSLIHKTVDISSIPHDTILSNDEHLKLENGIYYLSDKPFSGFIREKYETGNIKSIGSYYLGKQHGVTRTYFPAGTLRDERTYQDNVSYGRHFGFWENGHQKFDFLYYNDKREGLQKQWYESGEPYAFLNFKDDQEDGMQRAWRINGKPYINYEAKDGIRYGLQKAALCYTLKEEKLK